MSGVGTEYLGTRMKTIHRPSNGIRELAAGLEDELFGPVGYQWFLEENARDFAKNRRRGQTNGPNISRARDTQSDTSLVEAIEEAKESKQKGVSSDRKPSESSPNSKSTQPSTPVTGPPTLRPTNVYREDEVLDIDDDSIDYEDPKDTDYVDGDDENGGNGDDKKGSDRDDRAGENKEIDEIDSTSDEMEQGPASHPNRSTFRTYNRLLNEKSPSFPLTLICSHASSTSPSRSSGTGRSPVVNRMYVDLGGLPKIPKEPPVGKALGKLDKGKQKEM